MFGKIFASMYDGTLATKGPWQALVTFQQMIVLCDRTGIIDMTPEALSRRTTIPLDIINIGIAALEQTDSASRSPELDGRRIVRLSDSRSWGWQIVNFEKYRKIRTEDDRREYMANLMRERRAKEKEESAKRKLPLAKLAHADADADAEAKKSNVEHDRDARETLDFLNQVTGRNFQPTKVNLALIQGRLKEGATPLQCRQVIIRKNREWKDDEKMAQYLRPATLFNATKFSQYQGELVPAPDLDIPAPAPAPKRNGNGDKPAWQQSAEHIKAMAELLGLDSTSTVATIEAEIERRHVKALPAQ
jgi:uncharacterized phage protein (TIGR02220 family)